VARVRDTDGTERPLTSHYLESASVAAAAAPNQVAVQVEMSAEGRYLLAELTERLLGQQLAIFVDDQLHVALTVRSPIVQGRAQISGHFTPEDARSLAIQLAGGPLPVPVHLADPPKS
jgi:SecD/SecF fusion protein